MPEYIWIYKGSEYARVIDMPVMVFALKSPYTVFSNYWDRAVLRTLSDCENGTLWKNSYTPEGCAKGDTSVSFFVNISMWANIFLLKVYIFWISNKFAISFC